MKQEQLNQQYILTAQSSHLFQKDYSHFNPTQNYSNNYSYYSPNQLFPIPHSWPYHTFYQQYYTKNQECIINQSPIYTHNHHNFLYTSGNEHQSQNIVITNPPMAMEQAPELQDSEDRKNQGKINRIRHINEVNKNRVQKKGKKSFVSYYWSPQENRRYCQFLRQHPGLFDLSVSEKKNLRVNVMMSKKVKTRSPQQCHSHHQKMIKKYGSIDNIVSDVQNETGKGSEGREDRDQVKDHVKLEDKIADL